MELEKQETLNTATLEEIKTVVAECRTIFDSLQKHSASKEEMKAMETKLLADFKPLLDKVDKYGKALDSIEAKMKSPEYAKAAMQEQQSKDMENFRLLMRGRAPGQDLYEKRCIEYDATLEKKGLATDDLISGGYRVAKTISKQIHEKLFEFDPIRQNATVEPPIEGLVYEYPIDTEGTTTFWVEERGTRSTTTVDKMGLGRIFAHGLGTMVPITQTMLDSADFPVESWYQGKVTRKLAYAENYAFILGNGVTQPEGLLTNPTLLAIYNATTNPTGYQATGMADELPNKDTALDRFLAMMGHIKSGLKGDCAFYGCRSTWFTLLTRKDATGRYYVDLNTALGPTGWILLGYPWNECPSWPIIAANAFPVGFGNLKEAYKIIDSSKYTIIRDPYTQKATGTVEILTNKYVGGKVFETEAFTLMKCEV